MSVADYSQKAEDHQRMLVIVKPVGVQLKPKSFNRFFDRISRLQQVRIASQQRIVCLRHKKQYPTENSDWGDFQAHRKVLGVMCLARCGNEAELTEARNQYEHIKQQYISTVFDSRLIVFGMNKDGSQQESRSRSDSASSDSGIVRESLHDDHMNCNLADNHSPSSDKSSSFQDPLNANMMLNSYSKAQRPSNTERTTNFNNTAHREVGSGEIWFYPNMEECFDLEDKLQEFAASLFWVLESKRLDRSQEKLDKLPLLTAPFERKDAIGIDTDSRLYRKKCQARLRKHLGDLCLLAGLPGEAMVHYQTCLDMVKSANDWLWLAGALEGLCSSSVVVTYPRTENSGLQRNLSFSVKRGSTATKEVTKKSGTFPRSYLNGMDYSEPRPRHCLLPDDIIDKYRDAITYYSKFKHAGIIEMEASIKASRVLIMQQKLLEAADFLQNVVYINLQLCDEEKIQRYGTLAQLYSQIGMQRKAAFFKRIAAMQCVSTSQPKTAWVHCYKLLVQALDGYKLSLDPKDRPYGVTYGWPILQLRVQHELIFCARRMGNSAIAIRHVSFVLHVMFEHLSAEEKQEMSDMLVSYTSQNEGTPQVVALENGIMLPPVPFWKFPTIKSFKLLSLPPHLKPVKNKKSSLSVNVSENPFIYSPLQMNLRSRKDKSELDFDLVEGDVCEVALQVFNPMPFELKVSNMALMTEGAKFESYPTNLSLPAESGPFLVKIMGTAKQAGKLTILGYSHNVLGVRSHCRLRDIKWLKVNKVDIEIVPSLPQVLVTTTLPKAANFSSLDNDSVVTSATATLFAGQSCECQIKLSNIGREPIEVLDVSLDSRIPTELLGQVLQWNDDNLTTQLPLLPNTQACFTVYIHAASSFLNCDNSRPIDNYGSPDRRRIQQWVNSMGGFFSSDSTGTVIVEALLKLQYRGGPGLQDGYCRQCAVALNIEIQPSLLLQKWDVIPSESCDKCNLVFDLENASPHAIDLCYASDQELHIESKKCKRFAVTIPRYHAPQLPEASSVRCSHQPARSSVMRYQPDVDPVSEALQKVARQHMATSLDIRWKMPSPNLEGRLSLDKVTWSPEHLDNMQVLPIQWRIHVNNEMQETDRGIRCRCGDPVDIECQLTNHTGCTLLDAHIQVRCYQDLENGIWDQDLQDRLLCIGSSKTAVHKIPDGSDYSHKCLLMFLNAGDYKLDVTCSGCLDHSTTDQDSVEKQCWRHLPAILLHVME